MRRSVSRHTRPARSIGIPRYCRHAAPRCVSVSPFEGLPGGRTRIGLHYGVYREISAGVRSIALIQPVAPKRSPGPPVVTVARAAPKMSDAARGSSAMRSAGCMCAASTPAIGNRGAVHEHRRRWLSQSMRIPRHSGSRRAREAPRPQCPPASHFKISRARVRLDPRSVAD